jgi:hypothetical protein
MALTATRDDKFAFGLWTVGYTGSDRSAARRGPRSTSWKPSRSSMNSAPTALRSTTMTCSRSGRPTPKR